VFISRTRGGFVLPIKEPGITADVAICLTYEELISAPGRIRTCDPRIRSPLLCPAELRAHGIKLLQNRMFSAENTTSETPSGSSRAAVAHDRAFSITSSPPKPGMT
jgi:hypothetical protein